MDTITTIIVAIVLLEVSYLVYATARKKSTMSKRKVFVDTSALMDGRIVTAARTGFIPDALVVPKSVVSELQLLADQADSEKRARARRGLDAIKELQEVKGLAVTILDDGEIGSGGVDARLVELAKKYNGMLCTIDFNLNKVATVNEVTVLNINELAGSIRMAFLPGETINLPLLQKGQGEDQAVGYLADGTMVVVDKAGNSIGKTVQVEFIRSLQTAAGRMMFAKLANASESEPKKTANGRKQVTAKKTAKPNPVPKPRRNSKSNEDNLIELVNNQ